MIEGKKRLSCIAVDDEPMSLEIIETFCEKIPSIDLVKTFNNPFEAIKFIKHHKPDFVFLDIKMPEITGIQMIEKSDEFPPVIFTTAFSEYAVKSYKLNAIDYLLKPFDFERFYNAVEKVLNRIKKPILKEEKSIVVKVEYRNIKIPLNSILYIEAMDNYVKIYNTDKYYLTQMSLKKTQEELNDENFIRIHKSYIISTSKIDYFSSKEVKIGDKSIPVGRTYSKEFLEKMKNG